MLNLHPQAWVKCRCRLYCRINFSSYSHLYFGILKKYKKNKTQRNETPHTQHTHQRRRPKREDLTQDDINEHDRPDEGNHLR